MELVLVAGGVGVPPAGWREQPLIRAVLISLFSWRRANADDVLPFGNDRQGWWADEPQAPGNALGSRLWLLSRTTLSASTPKLADAYALEALDWMLDEGVCTRLEVTAQRMGLDELGISLVVVRDGAALLDVRFENVWRFLHAV
jgi:phage gp46-like protein